MITKNAKGQDRRLQSKTVPETTSPVCEAEEINTTPAYIRLPKTGRQCAWTGLTRGSLNDLILGPDAPVQSVVIRQPGASRGVRLIHFQSLLEYLDGLMTEQADNLNAGEEVRHD